MSNITKKTPFPLLDLPAELRDWIYDYLSGDETSIATPQYEAWIAVKDYPLRSILQVNKQVKTEYEKRARLKTSIIISDHEDFNFTLLPFPEKVRNVKRMEVRMFVVCDHKCPKDIENCDAANDLRQTLEFLTKLHMQLPGIESVELNLGMWWKAEKNYCWPDTPHGADVVKELQKLATDYVKLERLALYQAQPESLEAKKITFGDEIVSWTNSGGWKAAGIVKPLPQPEEEEGMVLIRQHSSD